MPVETRRIVFTEDELVTAAIEYCLHRGMPVGGSEVSSVEVGAGRDEVLRVDFVPDGTFGPEPLCLTNQQLMSALVLFCGRNQIPLPRRSEKFVQCKEGEVAMLFRTDRKAILRSSVAA